ncbi:hypothetical protein C9374_006332 [Naegleria lovaniensis]|uniref:BTB domain-containing protein n=1 Tax=Naegleria lovaniensis TaxID=51637 RepID=A0AA88GNM1_NAELO|nr:uncharacterized protein C9374_006332 [Naegleria lovaniensis]KAG2381343.1 hypothetical protein C9374_006332 [Naegleria lovaniensis]
MLQRNVPSISSNLPDSNMMSDETQAGFPSSSYSSLIQTGDMITIQVPVQGGLSKPSHAVGTPSSSETGSCEVISKKSSSRSSTVAHASYYHLLYDCPEPICPPDFVINIKLIDMNMAKVQIKVHKVFLAVESTYFRVLVNSDFSENQTSEVEFELTSIERDVFEQIILKYIYGERTLIIDKGLPYACTLCLAHYLQINALECQLLQQMTKTAKYTRQHLIYYSQLRDHTMLAINSNFLSQSLIAFGKDISKKKDEVINLPVEFFIWLISLDNLNVSNEDEVYDLVNEYIEKNEHKLSTSNLSHIANSSDTGGAGDSKNSIESVWVNVRVPFLSDQKVLDFMDNRRISTELKISLLRKRQVYAIYREKFKKKAMASKQHQQQQPLPQTQDGSQVNASMSVETNNGGDTKHKDDITPSASVTAVSLAEDLMIDLDDPQFIKRGNIVEYLITGSKGVIQIWDINNNECLSTFPTDSFVRCLALYERNYLLSGGHDKKIKKWNLRTNECELVLKGHTDYVLSFALVDDSLYSAGGVGDSTVKKWNLRTNQLEASLEGHQKAVLSLIAYSDLYVFSGGEDSTIRKWNVRTNKCELVITATAQNDDKLWCLAIYGNALFAGGSKGKIYQFNVNDGRLEKEWAAHENIVIRRWNLLQTPEAVMSAESQVAASTNTPYVCDAVLKEHTDSVRSLNVYNNYLYSGGGDEKIVRWNLLSLTKESVMTAEEYICSALLA